MNKQEINDALLAVARDLGADRISLQDARLRLELISLIGAIQKIDERLIAIQDSLDRMEIIISRIKSKIGKID
ncbi:hypothetical protein [Gorillibacterium massiliense]|uniref:hypothetical protein n=1 Tax=Gorillibacterium massiliense TaxID=1280390 RepID=UPI000592BACE|nr:hypothetical protein [Gorillibacterium massiliense]